MNYKEFLSDFGKKTDEEISSVKSHSDLYFRQVPLSKKFTDGEPVRIGCKKEVFCSGILLTSFDALSRKFNIGKDRIEEVIKDFCEGSALIGMHWDILNVNNENYSYAFECGYSWEAYRIILNDYINGMGIEKSPELSLFIIGGDDVIPMPRIDCPLQGITKDPLTADFLYCFAADDEDYEEPICNVGRLPLEDGVVKDGLDLIEEYFNKFLAEYDGDGLDINRGVMTSTATWLPSSREMIRDLPIEAITPEFNCTDNNIFVSPNLDANKEETQDKFNSFIGDADFLMFNLHGSEDYEYCSYYGENINHNFYPEAFTSDNMFSTRAKIINSTACYGGRYIGYNREHSLLLQAIYGPSLLYTASCTTALGRGNGYSNAVDILIPAGMSETLLKLYSIYLFSGMAAGEALLKSKIEYFNTCCEMDGYNEALSTILMFNLYGNPMIKMKPQLRAGRCGTYITKMISKKVSNKINLTTGIDGIMASTYNEVRESVNNNINEIRETIKETLFRDFGLDPDNLTSMNTIIVDGEEKGYMLTYEKKSGPINSKVFAKTTLDGKVQDIIHTK